MIVVNWLQKNDHNSSHFPVAMASAIWSYSSYHQEVDLLFQLLESRMALWLALANRTWYARYEPTIQGRTALIYLDGWSGAHGLITFVSPANSQMLNMWGRLSYTNRLQPTHQMNTNRWLCPDKICWGWLRSTNYSTDPLNSWTIIILFEATEFWCDLFHSNNW